MDVILLTKVARWAAAWTGGIVFVWLLASFFFRERSTPPGFRLLLTPGARRRRICRRILFGQESESVEGIYRNKRDSWWFRLKGHAASMFLAWDQWSGMRPFYEDLEAILLRSESKLDGLLDNARFYRIRPLHPWTAGGYVWKKGRRSERIMLAMERFLIGNGPLAGSAADHELMHCVQHLLRRVLDLPWSNRTVLGKLVLWFLCELHAHVCGGPLFFFGAAFVLLWPWALFFYFLLR
jgi:hypothetical protein